MKVKIEDIPVFGTELWKDILFPARCPVCHDLIPIERRGPHYRLKMRAAVPGPAIHELFSGYACRECLSELSLIEKPYCEKCGSRLLKTSGTGTGAFLRCADCAHHERAFRQCRSLMAYDEIAQEILTDIKYRGKREYIQFLSALLAFRFGPWIRALSPDAFVPVPIHPERRRTRGFNQAELLAEALSEILSRCPVPKGKPVSIPVRSDLLLRIKKTEAQKGLNPEQRLLNLQNAFEAPVPLTEHPRLILIDDIYTTGATMNACAEALRDAGASDVYGICVAAALSMS